jgi:hypothetical protein
LVPYGTISFFEGRRISPIEEFLKSKKKKYHLLNLSNLSVAKIFN